MNQADLLKINIVGSGKIDFYKIDHDLVIGNIDFPDLESLTRPQRLNINEDWIFDWIYVIPILWRSIFWKPRIWNDLCGINIFKVRSPEGQVWLWNWFTIPGRSGLQKVVKLRSYLWSGVFAYSLSSWLSIPCIITVRYLKVKRKSMYWLQDWYFKLCKIDLNFKSIF